MFSASFGNPRFRVGQRHDVPLRALDLGNNRRSAPVAMHQFEAFGVALHQQSELDQADDHRKEFATSAGQHVLVPGSLPGLLVGLLGQDPRFDKLFEPNRGPFAR